MWRTQYSQVLQVLGKLILLVLLLSTGRARAQAPSLAYSGPVTITQGGTYTGNYRSTDSAVPAVQIATTQPVVLLNCTLAGPGDLIYSPLDHADLTVRECRGYGAPPTADNTPRGVFLYAHKAQNLVVEHNYLESNQGMVLDRWTGDGSSGQTVRVRYNRAVNLDGSYRNDPAQGTACFLLLNTINNVANIEISWNQIVNLPNQSSVSDNLNFYDSGGTGASPARVHDNYVQGAYPVPATSPNFNGTGLTTDGEGTTAATSTGYVEVDHNQFVSTCNGGINVASGHDINVHDNRVVTSGYLPNGDRLNKLWCGINPSNFYGSPAAAFGANIRIADNTVGYSCWGPTLPFANRFDIDPTYASVVSGNVHLPNPLTVQTEQNEWALWLQKLQLNGVTPGLSGTAPPVVPPVVVPVTVPPVATPLSTTAGTFYRAFNLNGPALALDGHDWESGTATGLQVTGNNFAGQGAALNPATDAARAGMIRSSVCGGQVQLTVNNVPAGAYQVYLYVWEDNAPETFSVSVNGQAVQREYSSGAAGHWDRLGPYAVAVSGGNFTLATSGGTANCSGLEIWTADTTTAPPATVPPVATPLSTTAGTFYRAFNLNGPALALDGHDWESGTATGLQVTGNNFAGQGAALNPATDAARAGMIRSSVCGGQVQLTVNNVPAGAYQVYLYVWEDNAPETFSVSVNGQAVQREYSSGAAGHWDRLGPYAVAVSGGNFTLATSGGTANCSGLEIWTADTTTTLPATAPPVATPPSTTAGTFYRGINLHGGALSLDGNAWEGSAAPNYSVNGSGYGNQGQALLPATDAARAGMLRECQYGTALDFRLTAVPAGTYRVYAYVWEDNAPETFALAVNGVTVARNLSTGAAGSWAKLGPYAATVSNGTLQLATAGGTVNLSGVEVWSQPSGRPGPGAAAAGVFPNPLAAGQTQVRLEATLAAAESVRVQVLNAMGVPVATATLRYPAGTSSQPLAVGSLAAGPYVVRFVSGSLAGTALTLLKQ